MDLVEQNFRIIHAARPSGKRYFAAIVGQVREILALEFFALVVLSPELGGVIGGSQIAPTFLSDGDRATFVGYQRI